MERNRSSCQFHTALSFDVFTCNNCIEEVIETAIAIDSVVGVAIYGSDKPVRFY